MKNTTTFRSDHEYIIVGYNDDKKLNKSLEKPNWTVPKKNTDNDTRGAWESGSLSRSEEASIFGHKNYYSVNSPSGRVYTRQFDFSQEEFLELDKDNRIYWGASGSSVPRLKIFENELRKVNTSSLLLHDGTTTEGYKLLNDLMETVEDFGKSILPKPIPLMQHLIQIATTPNALILDAFAGSGTTGHAVLKLNAEDGGHRKFILLQQPEALTEGSPAYEAGFKTVDDITRKRIRRVIDGVPTAKDAQLKEGLGGSFTAVTLGQAIDPLKILKGEDLPSREALARYLYYTLELTSLPQVEAYHPTGFFAESESRCYYLHYEASKEWFLTQGANLTASQLEAISKHANKKGKEAFVLAPAYYISKEDLPKNVIAHHIPYDIQRLVFNSSEED